MSDAADLRQQDALPRRSWFPVACGPPHVHERPDAPRALRRPLVSSHGGEDNLPECVGGM